MQKLRMHLLASVLSLGLMAGASAATITFAALPGDNGDNFTTYSEAGFQVSNTAGQFQVAKIFGNPTPSIFTERAVDGGALRISTVTVTRIGGGAFTFGGFDLASNNGNTFYSIIGRLAGDVVLNQSARQIGAGFGFNTILSGLGTAIDSLSISLTAAGTSANIDNIQVTASGPVSVPEPASIALLLTGLLGLGAALRRA